MKTLYVPEWFVEGNVDLIKEMMLRGINVDATKSESLRAAGLHGDDKSAFHNSTGEYDIINPDGSRCPAPKMAGY